MSAKYTTTDSAFLLSRVENFLFLHTAHTTTKLALALLRRALSSFTALVGVAYIHNSVFSQIIRSVNQA